MMQVIVSVRRDGVAADRVRDLEVPAEMPSGELASLIVKSLGWHSNDQLTADYRLVAEPPGKLLAVDESLADAGAWDGAWVTVFPPGTQYSPPHKDDKKVQPPHQDFIGAGVDGPLGGWTPLDISWPTGTANAGQKDSNAPPSSGFAWKQLD